MPRVIGDVFRVQHADGRGPWRPGFSNLWVDHDKNTCGLPSILEDPPISRALAGFNPQPGFHYGCGCRTLDQLRRWFSRREYTLLTQQYGFHAVQLRQVSIIAESDVQALFASATSFWDGALLVDLYTVGEVRIDRRSGASR